MENVIPIEGNGYRPSHRGDGYRDGGAMYSLNTTEVHAVCYRIGSYYSNSMMSKNPYSGIYETSISPTLDEVNTTSPSGNQGGLVIVSSTEEQK